MTSNALQLFRATNTTNAAKAVTTAKTVVKGYLIINLHSAAIGLRFYDVAAASVSVGTTTPKFTVQVKANDFAEVYFDKGIAFDTAVTISATTEIADAGATAAATLPIVQILYE